MAVRHPVSRRRPRGAFAGVAVLVLAASLAVVGCEADTLYEATGPDGPTLPPTGSASAEAAVSLEFADRVERTDTLRVRVTGWDPSAGAGIERLGFTLVAEHDDGSRSAITAERTFAQGAQDTVSALFEVQPEWISTTDVPARYRLEVWGYAVNRQGDCAAAVPDDPDASYGCRSLQVDGQSVRAGTVGAEPVELLAVAGRTTLFPNAPVMVGDLVVDAERGDVYLSDRMSNVLHAFRPDEHRWSGSVAVGSGPWGLHLNRTGDTLLVANSGGTSVSRVALDGPAGPREVVSERLQTRNTALWEFSLKNRDDSDDDVLVVETFSAFDFSDRPQFVAQDAQGRILYSTRPTPSAPAGTVRWVEDRPGWSEPEARIVVRVGFGPVREELDLVAEDNSLVIAHADSVIVYFDGDIQIYDHPPGFPEQLLTSGKRLPIEAAQAMVQNPQSDVEAFVDAVWNLEAVSFGDTTYVASSGDREFVAFGDGGSGVEAGKILLWHAGTRSLSSRLTVSDLVNNASERVRALKLNGDGSLGMARGAFGTYFFSNDLRLRGTVSEETDGGGGAALHPSHPDTPAPAVSSTSTLAFTLAADRSIRILDTVHYLERGRIPIRDAIAGPMRVTGPLASDNGGQGSNCSGADCVIAKLYAVTDAGGVVVVDILNSHIGSVP